MIECCFWDVMHDVDVETIFHLKLLTHTNNSKSFLKPQVCAENYKLQFPGHHSYFRKDFQMLLVTVDLKVFL